MKEIVKARPARDLKHRNPEEGEGKVGIVSRIKSDAKAGGSVALGALAAQFVTQNFIPQSMATWSHIVGPVATWLLGHFLGRGRMSWIGQSLRHGSIAAVALTYGSPVVSNLKFNVFGALDPRTITTQQVRQIVMQNRPVAQFVVRRNGVTQTRGLGQTDARVLTQRGLPLR